MDFEDFLRWHDINLVVRSLNSGIKGFAYHDGNSYLIVINSRYEQKSQQESTLHELVHILKDHFSYSEQYVELCEQEANSIVKEIKGRYLVE